MINVKGNGNIVSREKEVSSFVRLHIRLSGNIELIQADEEKVVIEADENLHEYLEIINSGRTLYVTTEGKWRVPDFTGLKVKIYYRQLYNIYNACEKAALVCANALNSTEPVEVKIYTDKSSSRLNIHAPSVKLITACVGDVWIEGTCGLLEINAKSQGNLHAKEMIAKNVSIKNYSQGNLEVHTDETITISNYGQGNIHYWGNGLMKDIKHNGDGEVKHKTD